jgi:hypothetical protein
VYFDTDPQHLGGGGAGSKLAYTGVVKLAIRPTDGSVWTLTSDSWLSANGNHVWANTEEFAFAADGSFYKLDQGTNLYHQTLAGDWQFVASNVSSFGFQSDGLTPVTQAAAFVDANGVLEVYGSLVDDNIRVAPVTQLINGWIPTITSYTVTINGHTILTVPAGQVRYVAVYVGGGNDTVICAGINVPAYIRGDAIKGLTGNEILVGGNKDDVIYGGPGNNILDGGYGNDHLYAGVGGNNILDPYYSNSDDPYGAGGAEGNDEYTVPGTGYEEAWSGIFGSGWKSTNGFRIIHRSDGTTVQVREDNPGKDQLEFNGYVDHLDDDGFWSDVGSFIENNIGTIISVVGAAFTGGTSLLGMVASAGAWNLVGQAVDVAAEGKSFSLASFVGSVAGGFTDGLFTDFGASEEALNTAQSGVTGAQAAVDAADTGMTASEHIVDIAESAAQKVTSNLASTLAADATNLALHGGSFNWSSLASAAAGGLANGAVLGADLINGDTTGADAANGALAGAAGSLASQATTGHIDWLSVLGGAAQGALPALAQATTDAIKGLFEQKGAADSGSGPNPNSASQSAPTPVNQVINDGLNQQMVPSASNSPGLESVTWEALREWLDQTSNPSPLMADVKDVIGTTSDAFTTGSLMISTANMVIDPEKAVEQVLIRQVTLVSQLGGNSNDATVQCVASSINSGATLAGAIILAPESLGGTVLVWAGVFVQSLDTTVKCIPLIPDSSPVNILPWPQPYPGTPGGMQAWPGWLIIPPQQ